MKEQKNLLDAAIAAYRAYCEAHGAIPQQPCANLSRIGRKYVHLRNIRGKLAKYDIAARAILENN